MQRKRKRDPAVLACGGWWSVPRTGEPTDFGKWHKGGRRVNGLYADPRRAQWRADTKKGGGDKVAVVRIVRYTAPRPARSE